jgi:iron complex transport system permease protein
MPTTRVIVVRQGSNSVRFRRRTLFMFLSLLSASIAITMFSITMGEIYVSPIAWVRGDLNTIDQFILIEFRSPRVLCALISGFAFGVGGSLFQNLTRNPLGSPDVLGIIAGASTGAIVAATLFNAPTEMVAFAALVGACMTAGLLMLVAIVGHKNMSAVIITGVGCALLLNAINSWLLLRAAPDVSYQAGRWSTGTLEFASWYQVPRAAIALLVVLALLVPVLRSSPLFGFSTLQNLAIGARPDLLNGSLMSFGLALTAIGVWTTGPFVLLAFMAPQVAKRLMRTEYPPFYSSGLVGGIILLASDLAIRALDGEGRFTVGSVVLILGGTYLLALFISQPKVLASQ